VQPAGLYLSVADTILVCMPERTANRKVVLWLAISIPSACYAQDRKPCDFLTKSEAESIVGLPLETRANTTYTCWFIEPGFTGAPPKNKQVSLRIFRSPSPQVNDLAERRRELANRHPVPVVKDITDFGDAAIWTWTPGLGGELYAYKGGDIQVEVRISGIPEDQAIQNARALAARPLGGTNRTGFAYLGAPKNNSAPSVAENKPLPLIPAIKAAPPTSGAINTAPASAPVSAVLPNGVGGTFSKAPYINMSQFFGALKEVSLDLRSDPALAQFIPLAEQRNEIGKDLAGYGISVRPNSPVTLVATVADHEDLVKSTAILTNGRVAYTDDRMVRTINVTLQFFVKAAALRNGKLHLVRAAAAMAWYSSSVAQGSDIHKFLVGDEMPRDIRNVFVKNLANCFKDIAAGTRGEEEQWSVNSWNDKARAAVDADFVKIMSVGTFDRNIFDGLTAPPRITLPYAQNSDDCADNPNWRNSWNTVFQRLHWDNMQQPQTVELVHWYSCTYAYGAPPRYFDLTDRIYMLESNVVFELNGKLVRKRGEIRAVEHQKLALDETIKDTLKEFIPRNIQDFLTDLALGN